MTFRKLVYFQVAAFHENFTKAASELGISQASLSKSISALENELSTTLFNRTGNTVSLNQNGKLFLVDCQKTLEQWRITKEKLTLNDDVDALAQVTVAFTVATSFLPDLLSQLSNSPFYSLLKLTYNFSLESPDIIVSSTFLNPENYESLIMLEENIQIAIPNRIKIEFLSDSLTLFPLSLINRLPMFTLTADNELRQTTDNYITKHYLSPMVINEINTPSLFRNLTNAGLATAFIPEKTWKIETHSTQLFPLEEPLRRRIIVNWKRTASENSSIILMKNFLVSFFAQL